MKKILTIAGSDSGGGAGIQADIKTITVLGSYAASVVTSITAQNTLGVQGVLNLEGDIIGKQLDSVLTDISFDAAKTGMLANSTIIKTVAQKISQFKLTKLVVDPVMVATSGDVLLEKEAIQTLQEKLLPLAYIITPNISEAEVLTNIKITDIDSMKKAAQKIYSFGPHHVLVKGGHLTNTATDILFDGKDFHEFKGVRIKTNNTHGTGCTLSAAIATFLGQGNTVLNSVKYAKEYITTALENGVDLEIGQGSGPVNHLVK